MTDAIPQNGRSMGRMAVAIILAVIAVLAIVAAIMYFTEPAKSLPSVLGTITRPASRAAEHRSLRAEVALAFGVVCLVAAGAVGWLGRSSSR